MVVYRVILECAGSDESSLVLSNYGLVIEAPFILTYFMSFYPLLYAYFVLILFINILVLGFVLLLYISGHVPDQY